MVGRETTADTPSSRRKGQRVVDVDGGEGQRLLPLADGRGMFGGYSLDGWWL